MVRSSSHSWLHSALGKGGRMMGCFPCFESKADFHVENVEDGPSSVSSDASRISAGREQLYPRPISVPTREIPRPQEESEVNKIAATTFTFSELAGVTNNFREDNLLGEGGFGRVYKGRLRSTGQVVAVKQLDRNGLQGNREFLVEVLMLSLLHHPNLVNLIGYCAEGDQRLLVYEFMPLGSLEDHLHGAYSRSINIPFCHCRPVLLEFGSIQNFKQPILLLIHK